MPRCESGEQHDLGPAPRLTIVSVTVAEQLEHLLARSAIEAECIELPWGRVPSARTLLPWKEAYVVAAESRAGSTSLDDEASFCSFIQSEFDLPDRPNGRDRLVEDLGFDSLLMLELIVVIHEAFGSSTLGSPQPPSEYPILTTVEDALAYAIDTAGSSGEVEAAALEVNL